MRCLLVLTIGLLVASICPASGGAQQPRMAPPGVTAFVNVSVVPMDSERVLPGQTVIVQSDRVVAMGPVDQVPVPGKAVRIDGQGKFLIPGLADMHMHLGNSEMPGLLTAPDADSVTTRLERRLILYLAYGVTFVRNMDAGPWHVALRERVAKGELVGPVIYTSGPQVHAVSSPAMAVKIVADQKAAGYDFIKVYNPEIDAETYDTFVAAASRAKMPLAGHTPMAVSFDQWLNAHPASIEHLTGYPLDDGAALAAATARAGVWNCPTQVIYGTFADQKGMAQRARFIKTLHDSGAGLLLGTDAATSGVMPGESVHKELELMVAAGLTPYEALATSTRNVAAAVGTLDRAGTVEVGKHADLVLLKGNPLENIQNTAQLVGVMIGGRWHLREEFDAILATFRGSADPFWIN